METNSLEFSGIGLPNCALIQIAGNPLVKEK